ncbi:MAG: sulfatase [Pseudomonadota bacterium]
MLTALLALLVACGRPSLGPTVGAVHRERPPMVLEEPGAPAAWRALASLEAGSFELPPHNLPQGAPSDGVYPLPDGWRREARAGDVTLHSVPMPVLIPARRYHQAPAGVEVVLGDEPLPYHRDLDRIEAGSQSWAVLGERLWVATREDPERLPSPVRLVHTATTSQQRRLAWSMAGLTAPEFVSYVATLGPETRTCLLLPAPGRASWTVALPEDAALLMGLGIRPRVDLSLPESDGLAVEVRVDGEAIWRRDVGLTEAFDDARIDLSRWAGRTVTLELATDPGVSNVGDLALLSSPLIVGGSAEAVRRVIIVGIDTLRCSALGLEGYARDTSPELDAWAGGAYVFDHAYAPAPRTKPSFRTAFTGAYPLPAMDTPTFGEVLRGEGFVTGGLSANVHLVPRFGFSDGFDTWYYDNGAKADAQVDRALAWLDRYETADSALFVHIMDPHIFYDAPGRYKNLYVEEQPPVTFNRMFNRWDIARMQRAGKLTEVHKDFIQARYDGEVRWMSHELGRLLAAIDELPGRSLVIVHSDHGEELWEHGGFEHNHTLYDELVHTVLWVRPPGGWAKGPHRIQALAGLIDLAPTLYELLGVPPERQPPMAGTSLAPLLDPARAAQEPPLLAALDARPLHVGYLMYDRERWGVIQQRGKYILQTASGAEELYDLAEDPGEQRDLAAERAADLPAWRARLAQATGWPVGPGLRVRLQGRRGQPVELVFPVPVAEAGIIDPEADRTRRANIEWGESPRATPEQVATVSLSQDGTRVRIEPGERANGHIYVLFGEEEPRSMRLEADGMQRPLSSLQGEQTFNGTSMHFEPGIVIVPRDTMAARLAVTEEDEGELEALRALGYVE